jgi:hypothetical protein
MAAARRLWTAPNAATVVARLTNWYADQRHGDDPKFDHRRRPSFWGDLE